MRSCCEPIRHQTHDSCLAQALFSLLSTTSSRGCVGAWMRGCVDGHFEFFPQGQPTNQPSIQPITQITPVPAGGWSKPCCGVVCGSVIAPPAHRLHRDPPQEPLHRPAPTARTPKQHLSPCAAVLCWLKQTRPSDQAFFSSPPRLTSNSTLAALPPL